MQEDIHREKWISLLLPPLLPYPWPLKVLGRNGTHGPITRAYECRKRAIRLKKPYLISQRFFKGVIIGVVEALLYKERWHSERFLNRKRYSTLTVTGVQFQHIIRSKVVLPTPAWTKVEAYELHPFQDTSQLILKVFWATTLDFVWWSKDLEVY